MDVGPGGAQGAARRAWLLLGVLAGVTVGVAAAGWAGARRTERAVPDAVAASRIPTAALLANDPSSGPAQRAEVAKLPGVTATYPFLVGFSAQVFSPPRLGADSPSLFPVTPESIPILTGALVAGRLPDPRRADEIVVDENIRDRFGLDIGATMVLGQEVGPDEEIPPQFEPADGVINFRERMTVVGIAKSVSSDLAWTPSSGFYAKYGKHMPNLVNEFVNLRDGRAGIPAFNEGVNRIFGHPVNVESTYDLYGIRKALNVTDLERDGLLLFALAALIGGGVLVGQALVRAVSASAADLPTWRAMGADRPLAITRTRRSLVGCVGRRCGDGRRCRDRAPSRVPARHRARLRPRRRHPRRLGRARHRRGRGARGGVGRRRRRRVVAGDEARARHRAAVVRRSRWSAPIEPCAGAR